jgi:antitoxin PrlF
MKVIKINCENPYRAGTIGRRFFALYRDGMTEAEVIAAAEAAAIETKRPYRALLRYDVRRECVSLVDVADTKARAHVAATFSRVSVKSQTVIPREVRERLGIKPGDMVRYRLTDTGVLLDKAPASEDDPFASFSEWSSEADEKAYADL